MSCFSDRTSSHISPQTSLQLRFFRRASDHLSSSDCACIQSPLTGRSPGPIARSAGRHFVPAGTFYDNSVGRHFSRRSAYIRRHASLSRGCRHLRACDKIVLELIEGWGSGLNPSLAGNPGIRFPPLSALAFYRLQKFTRQKSSDGRGAISIPSGL